MIGLAFLAIFAGLRAAGLGDPHPAGSGVIGFLTLTKYPPSLDFLLVMLGVDLLLLSAFSLGRSGLPTSPLATFGRAPLFFYLLHLYVLGALSWFFPNGTTFFVMYLVWATAIVAMYPACRWYGAFKARQPLTSWWRLL